ncbi:hypothetical protein J6590_093854 [Homalodisca vitripennis]|nr:hypothetical protein J6590_093854 [Homalodisca vitripennis]
MQYLEPDIVKIIKTQQGIIQHAELHHVDAISRTSPTNVTSENNEGSLYSTTLLNQSPHNQPSGPQGRKMKLLSEFLDGQFSIRIAQTQSKKTQETYLYTFNKADESKGVRGPHGRIILQQWPHQVHKQYPEIPKRKPFSTISN